MTTSSPKPENLPDKERERALIAWLEYHIATEENDRRLSPMRNERGDAVLPDDPINRRMCFEFVREARKHLSGALWGVSNEMSEWAKDIVCSWSLERQKCELAAMKEQE